MTRRPLYKMRKANHKIAVGNRAAMQMLPGETSSSKKVFRMLSPAGLGALAITVNPPPATAPATTEYFAASEKSGTRVLKKVMAALSLRRSTATSIFASNLIP